MKINGVSWDIVLTNNVNKLRRNDGSITLGITDKNKRKIYVYDNLGYDQLKKVLIHELVHAWMFSYGYYLTLDEEEFVCEFVSNYSEEILFKADELLSEIILNKF